MRGGEVWSTRVSKRISYSIRCWQVWGIGRRLPAMAIFLPSGCNSSSSYTPGRICHWCCHVCVCAIHTNLILPNMGLKSLHLIVGCGYVYSANFFFKFYIRCIKRSNCLQTLVILREWRMYTRCLMDQSNKSIIIESNC